MKQEFKKVEDIKITFIKKVSRIVVLAGIAFTLFSTDVKASESSNFSLSLSNPPVTELVTPALDSEIKVALKPNIPTPSDLMWNAFHRFQESSHDKCEILEESFSKIVETFCDIKFLKVAVDGDIEDRKLKTVFRLPDNVILSIIKEEGTHYGNFVGFNLFHNRQLLISDVIDMGLLKKYISNVQTKLQS